MAIWHLQHGRNWPCNITLVTAPPDVKPNLYHRAPALVFAIALAGVALHLVTGWRYGLFRDEFYYLACANHLDWGYVDHPPLSIVVLAAVRGLLGDSLLAVRLVPALLFGLLVWLAACLARELGGGRFAQTLAALSVAIAPMYLALTGFYSMNAFDLVVLGRGAPAPGATRPYRRRAAVAPPRPGHRPGPAEQDQPPVLRLRPGRRRAGHAP